MEHLKKQQGQRKVRTDRTTGARQRGKDNSSMKVSSKGSVIYSVDEARDSDWWTQSDGSHNSSQSQEIIHFCRGESRVQSQRCEVHQEEDAERERMESKGGIVVEEESTHTLTTHIKISAF